MTTEPASIQSTHISRTTLLSLVSAFSGRGRPNPEDSGPVGPHGPIIRQAVKDWLRDLLIARKPEAADGVLPDGPLQNARLSRVALNPQPLPPGRYALMAGIAETLISRAELLHEVVSATTSDAEKRGIIIVSGYVNSFVRHLAHPGFRLPIEEHAHIARGEGHIHFHWPWFKLSDLVVREPVKIGPPPPLEHPDWKQLNAIDLFVTAEVFAEVAKVTFDHHLRRVFDDAAEYLAGVGAERMG